MPDMRILIIKPSALGDVATTLPLLCDLKRATPDARIDWLIHPAYAALIEGHDALHQIIPFDRKKLAAWWFNPIAFKALRTLLKTLRLNRYDIVIDAQGLFRSGFLTRITGAKTRIGFAHAREGAPLAYTHKIQLPNNGRHMVAVDRMRALGAPLRTDISAPADFRMPLHDNAFPAALANTPDYVVVIPGARWDTKRWPIDRYSQLVSHLLNSGQRVVLLGSPDEKPLCDQIESRIPTAQSLLNLAAQTSLPALIAVLSRARLVIGNDSGPLHIAVALARPVVALYGPTSPEFVGPYHQLHHVLRHEVPCHPCRRKTCDHHSCMNGLPVERVWQKTQTLLTTLTVHNQSQRVADPTHDSL